MSASVRARGSVPGSPRLRASRKRDARTKKEAARPLFGLSAVVLAGALAHAARQLLEADAHDHHAPEDLGGAHRDDAFRLQDEDEAGDDDEERRQLMMRARAVLAHLHGSLVHTYTYGLKSPRIIPKK